MGRERSSSGRHSARKAIGRKNAALLQALVYASPNQRKAILCHAKKDLIRVICECCLNILRGNIPLKEAEKKLLFKHKTILRKLSSKNNNISTKKKLINQKGGAFLPMLLGPLLGALISNIF